MYDLKDQDESLRYFFIVNAFMFVFFISILDIASLFFRGLSSLIYGLLLTSYLSVPYYMFKEICERSGESLGRPRKYSYLLLSIIPFLNIVFSVIYSLRRRRIEQDMPFRSDWWKGTVAGIFFLILSVIFPFYLGGSGRTIEEQLRNTGPEVFRNLGIMASWFHWAILPSTIYLDRKYLENERGILVGRYLNIISLIPYISFLSSIAYLVKRYIKTR